jgi:hypothetical protein
VYIHLATYCCTSWVLCFQSCWLIFCCLNGIGDFPPDYVQIIPLLSVGSESRYCTCLRPEKIRYILFDYTVELRRVSLKKTRVAIKRKRQYISSCKVLLSKVICILLIDRFISVRFFTLVSCYAVIYLYYSFV